MFIERYFFLKYFDLNKNFCYNIYIINKENNFKEILE